jgi:N-acetylneuraminic acid mutarotase
VIDGKIYVAGGRPPGGSAFEVYDPKTDHWEKLPDLPTQRNHLAMSAVEGRIIVAGGRFQAGAMGERTDVVEIYDPATRRWTRGAPLPAPRGGITSAIHAGCMFVFGGEGENQGNEAEGPDAGHRACSCAESAKWLRNHPLSQLIIPAPARLPGCLLVLPPTRPRRAR